MAISSISSQNLNRNYQNYQKNHQQLASGKQVNKAADDAASLKIIQKLLKQKNGYDMGYRNAATSQDMLNVADGALSSVTDSLQRIRELSVQAGSDIYGPEDKSAIQAEIDQLKQSIGDVASQTQFNGKNILDGSMANSHVATGPDAGGMGLSMAGLSLNGLGIAGYDVTKKNFDISAIDGALNALGSTRSGIGASSNRLDSVMAYSANASINLTASQSRLEDLDYGKAVSELKKNQLLSTYSVMMQKKMLENENGRVMQLYRS